MRQVDDMGDRDAILESIFAAPADDAPRLVYADWLDEHGHPEQAEFVRRQIESYRTSKNDYTRSARAAALEASWNRFKIELMESLPYTEVRLDLYTRGLPERDYRIAADRFLHDASDWWPLFPVRRLTLTRWVEQVEPICRCDYLARVIDLALVGGEVDLALARVLIEAPVLASVRRLWVHSSNFYDVSREAARALKEHFGIRFQGIF
jgi:uncharacterized protein (TIGR02996 family)